MRQFLISMVCLLGVMTTATAQEVKSNSDVAYLWEKKTIAVKGGGQTPDVMKLLKAFHNQFPTWVTEQVLRRAVGLKDGEQYVSDDDYRVLVDRRNGYVDLASETDIDQMQGCGGATSICKNALSVFRARCRGCTHREKMASDVRSSSSARPRRSRRFVSSLSAASWRSCWSRPCVIRTRTTTC